MIRQLIPLAILLAAVPAQARSLLEVQGRLQDAGGRSLSGTYLLKFSLLDAIDGSKRAWQEARYVKAVDGMFTNILGDKSEIPSQLRVNGYRLKFEVPPGTGWTARVVAAPTWREGAEEAAATIVPARVETRPQPSQPQPVYQAPRVRASAPMTPERKEIEQYKLRLERLEKAV